MWQHSFKLGCYAGLVICSFVVAKIKYQNRSTETERKPVTVSQLENNLLEFSVILAWPVPAAYVSNQFFMFPCSHHLMVWV